MATIALTGVTGEIGGRVARQLDGSGVPLRLVVRDPARAPAIAGAEVAQADTFGRDHFHTEEHIRRSGVLCTFLRDSLYQDVLT